MVFLNLNYTWRPPVGLTKKHSYSELMPYYLRTSRDSHRLIFSSEMKGKDTIIEGQTGRLVNLALYPNLTIERYKVGINQGALKSFACKGAINYNDKIMIEW